MDMAMAYKGPWDSGDESALAPRPQNHNFKSFYPFNKHQIQLRRSNAVNSWLKKVNQAFLPRRHEEWYLQETGLLEHQISLLSNVGDAYIANTFALHKGFQLNRLHRSILLARLTMPSPTDTSLPKFSRSICSEETQRLIDQNSYWLANIIANWWWNITAFRTKSFYLKLSRVFDDFSIAWNFDHSWKVSRLVLSISPNCNQVRFEGLHW